MTTDSSAQPVSEPGAAEIDRLVAAGRLDEAAAQCRAAAAGRAPDWPRLADIELRRGNGAAAHAAIDRALAAGASLAELIGPALPAAIAAGDQARGGALMQQFDRQTPSRQIELLQYWSRRLEDVYLFVQASAMLRPLAERADASCETLIDYAQLLMKSHRAEDAAAVLERAATAEPTHLGVHLARIRLSIQLGDFESARSAAESALRLDPGSIAAVAMLSEIEPGAIPEASSVAMASTLSDPDADDERRAAAGLALGRWLETRPGRDGEAFEAFATAKRCLKQRAERRGHGYQRARIEARVDARKRVFPERLELRGDHGRGLLFIVGMPRSGTTLLDRILASHSKVDSVGENTTMPAIADEAGLNDGDRDEFERRFERHADAWRARYLQSLGRNAESAPFVVDKLPLNFWSVGLIATLFPAARILHARRDPRDVAVSSFRLRFPDAFDYVDDFKDFAHYYAAQDRIMAHWRRVLPEHVRPVVYERVVEHPGAEVAALLADCGLPWEDACLRFAGRSEPVYTLSMGQVRREVYREAAGRWRRFADHLSPLEDALERNGVPLGPADS